jgi:hypothetical protein
MRNPIKQLAISLLIASALLLSGCSDPYPREYSAAPLSARIVDSETGEPVEGAIVVAVYVMESLGGRVYTPLHYEETLTDKEGKFTFNGFDKKSVSKEMTGAMAPLGNRDPRLYAFAEGYQPAMYQRKYIFSKVWKTSHRISPLDGQVLTIAKTKNLTTTVQAKLLRSMMRDISNDINSQIMPGTGKRVRCAFNAIPLTLNFIQKQQHQYKTNDPKYIEFNIPQGIDCKEKEQQK